MKKLLTSLALLLFAVPQARAALLWVQNQTKQLIEVQITRKEAFAKNKYRWRSYKRFIKPKTWGALWGPRAIKGPMEVKFIQEDFKRTNMLEGILPMKKKFNIKSMQIKQEKRRGKPMYRQTWPKKTPLKEKHPWQLL